MCSELWSAQFTRINTQITWNFPECEISSIGDFGVSICPNTTKKQYLDRQIRSRWWCLER